MHDAAFYIQLLLSGVTVGSLYALIAIGYTMVYGILRLINFAHGDIFMMAGFFMVYISASCSLAVSIPLVLLLTVLLGVAIERAAYKPLRTAPRMSVMISAIGVSYLLQNLALLIFGADAKSFTSVVSLKPIKLFDGQVSITGEAVVTIITCIVIMVGLTLFVNKTKAGKAMQAVSEDKGAAQLMGINVNATITLTFAIGSALAAVAGALMCSAYPNLTPYSGTMPGIKAFVAAVFGGIGSIPGAMIGGLLIGVIEIIGKAYISSQITDAIVFAILVIVLLVKPTGILGKNIQEKV